MTGKPGTPGAKAEAAAVADPSGNTLVTVLATAPLLELVLLLMLGDPPKSRGNPGPIIPPVKGLKGPNWEIPSVTAAAAAAADEDEPKGEAAAAADDDAEEEEEEEEAAEVLADEAAEELEDPAEAPLFNMFRQFSSVLNIRQRDKRSSESAKTDPKSRDRNTQGLMMSPQRST